MFVRGNVMDAPAREGISTPSSGTSSNGQSSLSESTLVARHRSILHELAQLVADRAKAEPQVEREFKTGTRAAEHEFEVDFQTAIVRFAAEKEASEREVNDARQVSAMRFKADSQAAEKEFSAAR